ncbi:MAG: thioesterase family protein [Anaerolineales bacterium]|jgi:acyl-CoA thioester hydrolase
MPEQVSRKADRHATDDAFHFYHPIEIRYRDVDAQRHVNSAVYFTYLEQARASYLQRLGLWTGEDFDQIGIILAEQSCSYRAPIYYGQPLEVGVRAMRLGTKSLHFNYVLRHANSHQIFAQASTVLVAYSYAQQASIAIPDEWREKIETYEGTLDDIDE